MRAGTALKAKQMLDSSDMVRVIQAMARGIQERGKTEPGEKTMFAAWRPASQAIGTALADGKQLGPCLDAALAAPQAGAKATKSMIASKGRSARLGERSLGHMDPGAASAVTIIAAMQSAIID